MAELIKQTVMRRFHLHIGDMLQGEFELRPINLAFVFQVNCPGCFLYGIPTINSLYQELGDQVGIIGISTAFENFDLNTEGNTNLLLQEGKTIGATNAYLKSIGQQVDQQKILFPVAMDRMTPAKFFLTKENLDTLTQHNSKFELLAKEEQRQVLQSLQHHFAYYPKVAETFYLNQLQGTPSLVLFDQDFNIKKSTFGHHAKAAINSEIQKLLATDVR